jgi:S1-C subfamily serine protease
VRNSNVISGLVGGGVAVVIGAILIATGVIDNGKTTKTVVQQSPITQPASDTKSSGLTVSDIYKKVSPGVAFIQADVVESSSSPFGFPQQQRGTATGSGFVLDKQGYILTNAHVVNGASGIQVHFGQGAPVSAKLIGKDLSTDLALIKVDPSKTKLDPIPLGDSSKLKVGDPAVAIGNPFGFDDTVTTGIISALQRQINAPNGFSIDNVIQTDAAINPGNSGGPLLNAAGEVVGINSQIATGGSSSGGSVGIGFAIPINTAKSVIPQLKSSGKVEHAYIGVTTAAITPQAANDLNLPTNRGALVQDVVKGGPADKAGIRAGHTQTNADGGLVAGGDLITKVGGRVINKPDDIAASIADKKPGDKIQISFYRGKTLKSVTVTLGTRPSKLPSSAQPQDQIPLP